MNELKTNILKVLSAHPRPMASSTILKALPVGGRPKPKVLKEFLAGNRCVGCGARTHDRVARLFELLES